ncbi:MAG: SGNH/GDSL hydrolase family protein [Anaerolineae bacterium]|nr:SGNH/GDSL hydrolase family protein [Anaerolineae bacterium]
MRYRLLLCLLLAGVAFSGVALAAAQDTPPLDLTVIEAIELDAIPVMPELTETAREIYAQGQEAGLNPYILAKIGDCMTADENFLVPFGTPGAYDLANYPELQAVIDHFASVPARGEGFEENALTNPGLATTTGYTTVSVQDPIWADPDWCDPNESPLRCESNVSQPAFALIMFGTNDTTFFEPEQFNTYMRLLIDQTIEKHIVPVLYTFPDLPEFPEKSILFNQIVVQIARDYDLPLINLYTALEDLPDKGIDLSDPIHLSSPIDGNAGVFTPENLERGYTLRNLVTLQALDVLLTDLSLIEPAAEATDAA